MGGSVQRVGGGKVAGWIALVGYIRCLGEGVSSMQLG